MLDATAIVLSARPVTLEIPGVQVLPRVQKISSMAQLHAARLDALGRVTTKFCFYLDDDDELPADYLSVLAECASRDLPLAYTNELVRYRGNEYVREPPPYSREQHLRSPNLIHHLALMRTKDARQVAKLLPRGEFWTEHMLYFSLAMRGVAHIYRVGYIWNRSETGVSHWPQALSAQVSSAHWCKGVQP